MLYTCILVYLCQSQLLFIILLFYFKRKRIHAVYLYICILLLVSIVIYNFTFYFEKKKFMLYTCRLVYFCQYELLFISLFFNFEKKGFVGNGYNSVNPRIPLQDSLLKTKNIITYMETHDKKWNLILKAPQDYPQGLGFTSHLIIPSDKFHLTNLINDNKF